MAYLGAMRPEHLLAPTPSGLFCPRGGFFIDPTRPVERAVISHGHSDHARPGHGAVLATAISTVLCLASVLLLSRRHGMRLDAGTWLLALAPVAIGFGVWPALAACVALLVAAIATNLILSDDERRELIVCMRDALFAVVPFLNRRRVAAP